MSQAKPSSQASHRMTKTTAADGASSWPKDDMDFIDFDQGFDLVQFDGGRNHGPGESIANSRSGLCLSV